MLSHSTARRALRVRAYHSPRRWGSRNNYITPYSPNIDSRASRRYARSAIAEYSTNVEATTAPTGLLHRLLSHSTASRVLRVSCRPQPAEVKRPINYTAQPVSGTDRAAPCRYARSSSAPHPATYALKSRNTSAPCSGPQSRYPPKKVPKKVLKSSEKGTEKGNVPKKAPKKVPKSSEKGTEKGTPATATRLRRSAVPHAQPFHGTQSAPIPSQPQLAGAGQP